MVDFSPHLRQLFQLRGVAATYAAPGGAETACRAIRQGGGQAVMFGSVRAIVDRTFFHVRRAEVASPEPGGTLEIGDDTFTLDAVQPVERDTEQLLWQLEASWGATVGYRSGAGSGTTQSPPQGSGFKISENASAGASQVSINAGFIVGKLISGDKFTIAGDATEYTVTGEVTSASSEFADVPITPALALDADAGDAVTFDWARDYTIKAAISGYEAQEILGGVQANDRRLVILQSALNAVGMTDEPKALDRVSIGSRVFTVQSAMATYRGGDPIVWDVQVRA